jgi:hypothetical protein
MARSEHHAHVGKIRLSDANRKGSPRCRRRTRSHRLGCEPLEDRRLLAVITVTSALDGVADDGDITLRKAIVAANNDTLADSVEGQQRGDGVDTIHFDSALLGQTITLTEGQLQITAPVTVEGLGVVPSCLGPLL